LGIGRKISIVCFTILVVGLFLLNDAFAVDPPTIKITKNATNADGAFDFTITNGTGSVQASIPNTAINNMTAPLTVIPGTYNVTEIVPANWNLISSDCLVNGVPQNTTLNFNVTAGDSAECIFENVFVGNSTIKITKNATNADGAFDFTITNGTGSVQASIPDTAINNMTAPLTVIPGTYNVTEIVPANWNLISSDCLVNGVPQNTTLNFNVTAGDSAECIFENTNTDVDNDGIKNEIDTQPAVPSFDFSDIPGGGTTSGTITSSGDQTLTITEEPNPDGVKIVADISGGSTAATVSACGGATILTLTAGDESIVTCSSVTIEILIGPIEVEIIADDASTADVILDGGDEFFFDDATFTIESVAGTAEITFVDQDGTTAELSLTQNNELTFDSTEFTFDAPTTNTDDLIIVVDGAEITVSPGETLETTPEGLINSLIDDINDLVDDGVLNNGQGNSFTTKLDGALAKLAQEKTTPACNKINAFTNQVNAFINGGNLTPEQGNLLLDTANLVIDDICN